MPQALGVTVRHPLPYVAVHVVEAKLVRQEAPDRRGESESIATRGHHPIRISLAGGQVGAIPIFADLDVLIPESIAGSRAAARGVFPFRLRQQTIAGCGYRAQPLDVGDCIAPAHAGHGVIVVLLEAGRSPGQLRAKLAQPFAGIAARGHAIPCCLHEGGKLAASDLVFSNREGSRNSDRYRFSAWPWSV